MRVLALLGLLALTGCYPPAAPDVGGRVAVIAPEKTHPVTTCYDLGPGLDPYCTNHPADDPELKFWSYAFSGSEDQRKNMRKI